MKSFGTPYQWYPIMTMNLRLLCEGGLGNPLTILTKKRKKKKKTIQYNEDIVIASKSLPLIMQIISLVTQDIWQLVYHD